MTGFENIKSVYFLGIGGIGMSALARYFRNNGMRVAGYDRTSTQLTAALSDEGIEIHFDDTNANVSNYIDQPNQTLIVYTPAVPENHGELLWLQKNNYTILKRAKVLGMICNSWKCLAVAGTHGKTTVSTMAALILSKSAIGCGAFLGGISKNFNSNLVLPAPDDKWMVTEADEYDRSFLQLTPDVAVITSMDADHLDIYGKHGIMKDSFRQFAQQIRTGGSIVVKKELVKNINLETDRQVFTYSINDDADFFAADLYLDEESRCYHFRLKTPDGLSPEIQMTYPGRINVENAVAAAAAAFIAGASLSEIKQGLEEYQGVCRRFDIRFKTKNIIFIDDYAHHPNELSAFISSVKLLFPDKTITGIFQPHLYTRTRDFDKAFAQSLNLLDVALLLPIYAARELPIAGISSQTIFDYMTGSEKYLIEKQQVADYVRTNRPEILLTMGAGDIDLLVDDIIAVLKEEIDV